jgi:hypothetical protein
VDRRTIITSLLVTVCNFSCAPTHHSLPTVRAHDLPPAVKIFQTEIASIERSEFLSTAQARFGPPARDTGSGITRLQWDFDAGVLTVTDPESNPTFRFANGHTITLLPTRNEAKENILQRFEMTTLPDPTNHGTRFWIGNVHLGSDLSYRFVDSGSNHRDRGDQSANFFIRHPAGRLEITWCSGSSERALLEELGERKIARLRFVAADGGARFDCDVVSSPESASLSMEASTFEMQARWLHN